ncbi:hypothetical protein C7M84_015995 [Penaeus vannamei]|uniref:Uncharacterized protein n=1 Tax=Penaeus vannamei TaxID=6689 RepID=A0A3R7M373_PENVA|nr:hypothetical protein C7M84_015995 [Penaeus vannamei]
MAAENGLETFLGAAPPARPVVLEEWAWLWAAPRGPGGRGAWPRVQEAQGPRGFQSSPDGVDLQSISSTLRQLALHARDLDASLFEDSLQEQLGLRLSSFAASFGMAGLTLENFPERLAPWVGLFASDWGFRPMVVLGPLRDFLKGVLAWAGAALAEGRGLGETELRHVVHRALRDDVINTLLDVRQAMTSPKCFSRRLCEVSRGQDVTSLKRAVVRVAG